MSKKWNLVVDVARCDNCRNCFLATKDEHIGNDFPGYAAPQPARDAHWLDIRSVERGQWPIVEANFMPLMCNHCDQPPCMAVAKDGAVRKRDDGIVIIDPVRSKGQREIAKACPYGAVHWNDELDIPQAWIFDAHLLDAGWARTRIESVCPNDVFRSHKVTDAEMREQARAEGLEVHRPELGTQPRVWYRNLHLVEKLFVSGTVVVKSGGLEDCCEGARVQLLQSGEVVGEAVTDIFGEFKIDGLQPDSGRYDLRVDAGAAGTAATEVDLDGVCHHAGTMALTHAN